MACLPVRAISDAGHEILALEPTTHSVVNTLRLPPVGLWGRGVTWVSLTLAALYVEDTVTVLPSYMVFLLEPPRTHGL